MVTMPDFHDMERCVQHFNRREAIGEKCSVDRWVETGVSSGNVASAIVQASADEGPGERAETTPGVLVVLTSIGEEEVKASGGEQ